jgi:hypothetical protein
MTNLFIEAIGNAGEDVDSRKNAVKEALQETVLAGLSFAGFFEHAAFYGGTALRIFHGLDRFSEDLDFSLMSPEADFGLESYFPPLKDYVASFGLHAEIEEKRKTRETPIRSAFFKANTLEHLLYFYPDDNFARTVPKDEKIKIKFEIDTDPAPCAGFETKFRLNPEPYAVKLYDMPSLFAGKTHAVLCRNWRSRTKGRDLYDFVFYVARGARINIAHLDAKMRQTGDRDFDAPALGIDELRDLLSRRFETIDYAAARQDVLPFLSPNDRGTNVWCPEFFKQLTREILPS